MKKQLLTATCALASATLVMAGPEQIIKQRAKELRDQNNVRQGVPPPTQPPPAPPQSGAPATPAAPRPALSLSRFQSELSGISPTSPATTDKKQLLTAQLIASALTVSKPSTNTAARFVENLTALLAEKPLPDSSRTRLITELDAVLNPGKYPSAQLTAIFTDVQAIFQANGATRAKAAAIAEDVKALSAEAQKPR